MADRDRKLLFLWMLLLVLLAILAGLIYYFYILVASPTQEKKNLRGLVHVSSLYGFGRTTEDFFNKPHDVCVSPDGNLIVSDTRNRRIVKITPGGRLIRIYSDKFLMRPLGVDVSSEGRIYVADRFSNALIIFDESGRVFKRLSVDSPLKPCFKDNKLYLSTKGSVAVLDPSGEFLFHFGRFGRNLSEFSFPNGIAVDRERIYVSDTNNLRVQCFTLRGEHLWTAGGPAENPENLLFSLPAGIAVDDKGRLFLVDAFSDSIVALDAKSGRILRTFGGVRGAKDGEFNQPSGIDILKDDLFVIADKYNDRIQIVRLVFEESRASSEKNVTQPAFIVISVFAAIAILSAAAKTIIKKSKRQH